MIHALWKYKSGRFALQKSDANRKILNLHNQIGLLLRKQLACKAIHFPKSWSSIQIDSFVAHKRRSDLKQLLNRSQLHNLRRNIIFVISKSYDLLWPAFSTSSHWVNGSFNSFPFDWQTSILMRVFWSGIKEIGWNNLKDFLVKV